MILVTGGAGFVGLNVVEQLRARGDEVRVADFDAPAIDVPFTRVDVTQPPDELFAGVKQVIHLAAITAGPDLDAREPVRIAEVNLLGTIRMLDAARRNGVERFFYASTGALYGAAGVGVDHPLDEEADRPVPQTLYGITKYAAERSCLRLGELWNIDVRVGRLATAFGRWEHTTGTRKHLSPPTLATWLARKGKEAIFPTLAPTDYIYAPDLASAILAVLDASAPKHRLYHLGTGAACSLSEWCELLAERFPLFRWRESDSAPDDECNVLPLTRAQRTAFSNARLTSDLGWRPRFNLEQALDDFLDWMDKHES